MFFFILLKECNIANIKIIGPLQQFFNKYLFYNLISKCQKNFWDVPHLDMCVIFCYHEPFHDKIRLEVIGIINESVAFK